MNVLYMAHSGLRYLVLLAGVVALVAFAYALATRRPLGAARALMSAFTGLLDLQVLLGLGLVIGGIFYGALIGHLVLMVLAAVVAHVAAVLARRTPDERRALGIRLVGVAVALVCVAGGIMAIGRSLFGSAPRTVG